MTAPVEDMYQKMAEALTLFGQSIEGVAYTKVGFITNPDINEHGQFLWTIRVRLSCYGEGDPTRGGVSPVIRDTTWQAEGPQHAATAQGLAQVLDTVLGDEVAQRFEAQQRAVAALATLRDPNAPRAIMQPPPQVLIHLAPAPPPPVAPVAAPVRQPRPARPQRPVRPTAPDEEEEDFAPLDLTPSRKGAPASALVTSSASTSADAQGDDPELWEDDPERDDGEVEEADQAADVVLATEQDPLPGRTSVRPESAKLTPAQKLQEMYGKNVKIVDGKPVFPSAVPAVYDGEGNRVAPGAFLRNLVNSKKALSDLPADGRALFAHLQKTVASLPADERTMVQQLQARLDTEMNMDF